MNLTWAITHEAFFRTEGTNDLQFSLTIEVSHLNNLKTGSLCRGCKKIASNTVSYIGSQALA